MFAAKFRVFVSLIAFLFFLSFNQRFSIYSAPPKRLSHSHKKDATNGDNSGDTSGDSSGDNSGSSGDNSGDSSGNTSSDNSGDNSGDTNPPPVVDCTSAAPTIDISTPGEGELLSGSVFINAYGYPGQLDQPDACDSAPGITYMSISIDGNKVYEYNYDATETTASANIYYTWDTTAYNDGAHEIEVYTEDSFGGSDSASIDVGTSNFANVGFGGGGDVNVGGDQQASNDYPEGDIYDVADGVVTGWAVDINTPNSSVVLEFFVDGKSVGTSMTNVVDANVNQTLKIDGYHGFSFTLPDHLETDGRKHKVGVRAYATDGSGNYSKLAGSPVEYYAVNIPKGALQHINNKTGEVSGWAVDLNSPKESLDIAVYIDGPAGSGDKVETLQTNVLNRSIDRRFQITGDHGFAFQIPDQYLSDGDVHTLYVYALDPTGQGHDVLVQGSPKKFRHHLPKRDPVRGHGGHMKVNKNAVVRKRRGRAPVRR